MTGKKKESLEESMIRGGVKVLAVRHLCYKLKTRVGM